MPFPLLVLTLGISLLSAQIPAPSWSYIQNDSVKLGVRMDYGAGVAHFSKTSTGRNLLNHADHGRLLQQSFYGSEDGSLWNGKPWRWNPVQGGCWTGKVAGIVQEFRNDGKSLYARTKPINWAGCDEIDATMEEWIELVGNVAVIKFRFTNNVRNNTNLTHQEMPAVFVDYGLPNLVWYEGSAPWTDGPLTRKVPGWPNAGGKLSENWAAYLDAKDWGIGVYIPGTSQMTYYRYEGDGKTGPSAGACSYFAPIRTLAVVKGFTIEYMVYVSIGSLPDIRKEFRTIKETGKPRSPIGVRVAGKNADAVPGRFPWTGRFNLLGKRIAEATGPEIILREW